MRIRRATHDDEDALVHLRAQLWPEESTHGHRSDLRAILAGHPRSTLPLVVFVAEHERRLVGFAEIGLRSHADGCDPTRPCGFVEGWFVEPAYTGLGLGRALIERAEAWCLAQGCTEIASDTWIDREGSQRAHAALGFEIVDRCVNYRKALLAPTATAPPAQRYGADLARIHHDHFGSLARSASLELLSRLSRHGISSGTVVDLAAGTGILAQRLTDAGYETWGVDISDDMLRIARSEAPRARFQCESLWDADLPPCVAVAAVGEAFSYAADATAGIAALSARLSDIYAALAPGGLLLFDVAGPGRSGPEGSRRVVSVHDGTHLLMEEEEAPSRATLTRALTLFVPTGSLFRKVNETHVLRLYAPEEIETLLTRKGFVWERLHRYARLDLLSGWYAYAATRPS